MRIAILAFALVLAACETIGPPPSPAPLPESGPIVYTCSDGTQLTATFENNQARIAVVGGNTMVLPNAGTAEAPYYSNGRYGLRGRGANATWEVGRAAPVSCRGG